MSSSYTALPLPARVFGSRIEDLDIDFAASDRVGLAIRVVAETLAFEGPSAVAREKAAELPVGVRIVQLLYLLASVRDDDTLELAVACPRSGCGQSIELTLPLLELIEYGAKPLTGEDRLTCSPGEKGEPITLRRATGEDQRTWQQHRYATPDDASRNLLASLVWEGRDRLENLTPGEEHEIAEAMAEFDPLVGFRVSTRCPHCTEEATLPVDLERACLRDLHRHQRRLLEAVHRLASAYGWTERAILRLSSVRRDFYLARIEKAKGAPIG